MVAPSYEYIRAYRKYRDTAKERNGHLMNKAGYEAAYCTGYTNGGIYHAWNAIVYNGEITYIDSTYNASGNHMAYFCRNKEDLKERTENSIIWFSASDD